MSTRRTYHEEIDFYSENLNPHEILVENKSDFDEKAKNVAYGIPFQLKTIDECKNANNKIKVFVEAVEKLVEFEFTERKRLLDSLKSASSTLDKIINLKEDNIDSNIEEWLIVFRREEKAVQTILFNLGYKIPEVPEEYKKWRSVA